MQVSSTVSHGRAATGTASHCNTQSHVDDLVPRRDGAHHAVDRFPRVGLQAPSLCAHVQYSSGAPSASVLYVPASCVLYAPEAQGSSLCVRRARTSLGRAVRTAYRGTPGASSATSRRASCATPAAASASRCAETCVPGPPYGTHQCPGASGIRHRAAARGGHCCTSGYTSGSCRTYAYRVAHCRLNPSSNPNPDPDPQASCSSTPPSPSAATLCGPSPPPRSH